MKQGEIRETVFSFTNHTQEDITIAMCSACDCMTLDWTALPIKPGQSGKITAVFDSTKKDIGEKVNDYINVILENTHPGTDVPVIFELNYKALITN